MEKHHKLGQRIGLRGCKSEFVFRPLARNVLDLRLRVGRSAGLIRFKRHGYLAGETTRFQPEIAVIGNALPHRNSSLADAPSLTIVGGIRQGGIPVGQGVSYYGYLWLKASSFSGEIAVALEADQTGGATYAQAQIQNIAGEWTKYEFTLTPTKTDPLSKFVVLFHGRGRIWLDQVSLLPGNAVDGVRADVFQKIKALRPAFVRWPGGNVAQDYHWVWGIGPRDQRTTWVNLAWANEDEPSDFGTDEFIQFCRNLGAEPSLTVNVEGRGATAGEAAAWVEYANGPANSKYGAMRAANGHPEPLRVKYWELGNEIWGTWVRAHSDAGTYANNFNRYAAAMRAVDPSIRLIAVGDNDLNWNHTVLRIAGANLEYLAVHHYYGTEEMGDDARN